MMQTRSFHAISRQSGSGYVTSIPGRAVNPAKLASYLDQRFVNDYTVEMRRNSYQVTAPSPLKDEAIKMCM